MITISAADLASHIDKYLQEVARGETIEVECDGMPVALVVPRKMSPKEYWKNLRPLPYKLEGPSLTEVLLKEREEGR